jgi:hypothetical protein
MGSTGYQGGRKLRHALLNEYYRPERTYARNLHMCAKVVGKRLPVKSKNGVPSSLLKHNGQYPSTPIHPKRVLITQGMPDILPAYRPRNPA